MLQNLKSKSIRMEIISVFPQISKPPIRIVTMNVLAVLDTYSPNQRTSNRGSTVRHTEGH